jgi:uncharacterized repeat protein (TIGR01451 family)
VVSDQPGVDPLLAQPADNGGLVAGDQTETIQTDQELSGSPAIDAGTNSGCPATDARGVSRPQGSSCDIGAFEAAAANLSASNSAPAGGTTNIPFSYTIAVSDGGPGPSTGTTVTDQLPAGETLYGATASQGSCSSSGSPAKVTCGLGTINVSEDATVTLLVAEANPGSVTDTATASNDQGASVSGPATTNVAPPAAPPSTTTTSPPTTTGPRVSAPVAITGGHSNVTNHSAKLSGTVSTGGQSSWYFFQYGRTIWLGASGLFQLSSSGTVAATIGHLLPGKNDLYRLVAVNASGISYGTNHSLRTKKKRHT